MRMIALGLLSAAALSFAATDASAQSVRIVETSPRIVVAAPVPTPAVVVTSPAPAPTVVYSVGCRPGWYWHPGYWHHGHWHHGHWHHR